MSNAKKYLLGKVKSVVDYSDTRSLKDITSDALHLIGNTDKEIALKTNLSVTTIQRMRSLDPTPSGKPYNPHLNTIETILNRAGGSINIYKR